MLSKESYGIICFRKRPRTPPEVLLVQKTITHEYGSFVHGRYDVSNKDELINLFNNMNTDEKKALISLNFATIWYRLFGEGMDRPISKLTQYMHKKTIFEKNFCHDKGVKLRQLLDQTTCLDAPWEAPKGHKNDNETPIEAAKREFMEETGANERDFYVLDIEPYIYSFVDMGVKYTITYYFAIPSPTFVPHIRFDSTSRNEVSQIRWMSQRDIMSLNVNKQIGARLLTYHKKTMLLAKAKFGGMRYVLFQNLIWNGRFW